MSCRNPRNKLGYWLLSTRVEQVNNINISITFIKRILLKVELEKESMELKKQLDDLTSLRRKSADDVEEERTRREEIQKKLRDAEYQLSLMVMPAE